MSSPSYTATAHKTPNESCQNFVIAGGSFAAISAVKILAQSIIPHARKHNPRFRARITVIAPNTESYWNVAAVRLVVQPELIEQKKNQIFFNLRETLQKYFPQNDTDELNVIEGKVVAVDGYVNKITYQPLGTTSVAYNAESIKYDILILATGTSSSSAAFKLNSTSELTKNTLQEMAEEIKAASSICIVGAGAVGIELAGELGYRYGHTKKITLFSGIASTLEYMKPKASKKAVKKLAHLGVETVLDVRAVCSYDEETEIPVSNSITNTINENLIIQQKQPQLDSLETMKTIRGVKSFISISSPANTTFSTEICMRSDWNKGSDYLQSGQQNFINNLQPKMPSGFENTMQLVTHPETTKIAGSFHTDEHTLTTTDGSDNGISSTPTLLEPAGAGIKRKKRTIVEFDNGYKEAFDCLILTTGNIPNTSFLPYNTLNDKGYVLTDPYLRMLNSNPNKNIYVFGDLVASGKQTLFDISSAQATILKRTMYHDIISDTKKPLKKYKPGPSTYIVPISKKGGVGVLYGISMPGLIVSVIKSKSFMLEKSETYLGEE